MADVDDGGSAFPRVETEYDYDRCEYSDNLHSVGGMTLRDYFAGQALQGWLAAIAAEPYMDDYDGEHEAWKEHQREVAGCCYGYADAMLEARKR